MQYGKVNRVLTMFKKYYTVKEYAELKGVSEWWVRKLCRLGKVKADKFGGVWFVLKRNK